jgi:Flp pilus assembly protein TadG
MIPNYSLPPRRPFADRCRRGTAAVEFAMTAPVLFLLLFGALEFSRANMLRHTIAEAAYEGARRGIVPGATADEVRGAATGILSSASAMDYTIDVAPETIAPDTPQITVNIALPLARNSWVPSLFFRERTLLKSFTMDREKYETATVP